MKSIILHLLLVTFFVLNGQLAFGAGTVPPLTHEPGDNEVNPTNGKGNPRIVRFFNTFESELKNGNANDLKGVISQLVNQEPENIGIVAPNITAPSLLLNGQLAILSKEKFVFLLGESGTLRKFAYDEFKAIVVSPDGRQSYAVAIKDAGTKKEKIYVYRNGVYCEAQRNPGPKDRLILTFRAGVAKASETLSISLTKQDAPTLQKEHAPNPEKLQLVFMP